MAPKRWHRRTTTDVGGGSGSLTHLRDGDGAQQLPEHLGLLEHGEVGAQQWQHLLLLLLQVLVEVDVRRLQRAAQVAQRGRVRRPALCHQRVQQSLDSCKQVLL